MKPYLHVYATPNPETVITLQSRDEVLLPSMVGSMIRQGLGTSVARGHLAGLLSTVTRANAVWRDIIIHV